MSREPEAWRLANCLEDPKDTWMYEENVLQAATELRRLHEVNAELREKVAAMEKSYEDLASNLALANKNARMFQQRWQLAERLSPRRQGPINLDDCGAPHLKEDI